MPGISDSAQVDDLKIHLETLLAADNARKLVPQGETTTEQLRRESAVFRPRIRLRLEQVLADLTAQTPGLSNAEVAKLTATRSGRDAVDTGIAALARVDDHLQSVTSERNPLIAKAYGVHGQNPVSFGGVLRSLAMCQKEDDALTLLPVDDLRREHLFTPVVRSAVDTAYTGLRAVLGEREATRGELSRSYAVKQATIDEAVSSIAAARQHLYANLPDRKVDRNLYDYGFRPIHVTTGRRANGSTPDVAEPPASCPMT
ncbi:hypothetical protein [Chondromyces crocatus]|uniref:Uncharacterized protein n=1 Tax=Chondromyces crocatus TaxID=52 RepID=A0A0K1E9C1_CHOCO|nr:hypothetical protein [Chondromyces crocatus]AKT37470.1 uncharacterized protein CMC5_016110 [Chondromyces crocatus]